MRKSGLRSISGFTLIELLVVVAIIVVLLAMMMPALARAREGARTVACASGQRQIMMALRMYSEDYSGYYPYVRGPGGGTWPKITYSAFDEWVGLTMLYTNETTMENATNAWAQPTGPKGIWDCKSNPFISTSTGWATNYVYNAEIGWDFTDGFTAGQKPHLWNKPDQIAVIADAGNYLQANPNATHWQIQNQYNGRYNAGVWHNNGYNVGFLDGHVAWEKMPSDLQMPAKYFPNWLKNHGQE